MKKRFFRDLWARHSIFKKIFKQTWVVHAKSLLSLNTSLRGKARCISHRRLDSPFWCVHQCINIWCGALNLQAIYTVKRLYLCRGRWNSGPLSAFCSLQELIAHINVKEKCPAKSGSFEVRLILNSKDGCHGHFLNKDFTLNNTVTSFTSPWIKLTLFVVPFESI